MSQKEGRSSGASKTKKTEDGITRSLAEIGLENFSMLEVHRSDLRGAPYNPRKLGPEERKKLKAGLAKHGLVAPITWNKRTGNIVGGHQRLSQLDSLAKTNNYTLNVAVIDVDETKEKELNILLNNAAAQGTWDMELLGEILKDKTIDLAGTGFEEEDIFRLFGDDVRREQDERDIAELSDTLMKLQDQFQTVKNRGLTDDFYLVVVFKDYDDCERFVVENNLPNNRYQSGVEFRKLIRGGGGREIKEGEEVFTDDLPKATDTLEDTLRRVREEK